MWTQPLEFEQLIAANPAAYMLLPAPSRLSGCGSLALTVFAEQHPRPLRVFLAVLHGIVENGRQARITPILLGCGAVHLVCGSIDSAV
jgi:hypothetical protein